MAAVQEQRRRFVKLKTTFAKRLSHHLNNLFIHQVRPFPVPCLVAHMSCAVLTWHACHAIRVVTCVVFISCHVLITLLVRHVARLFQLLHCSYKSQETPKQQHLIICSGQRARRRYSDVVRAGAEAAPAHDMSSRAATIRRPHELAQDRRCRQLRETTKGLLRRMTRPFIYLIICNEF